MTKNFKNKIEANDTSIKSLLKEQKFYIDYFQREYRWEEKHIKLLVEDLTTTFLKSYKSTDARPAVAKYQSYYLGPIVFSLNDDDGKKSIIDGQQRITSITLFLIYLNHLQADNPKKVKISDLIFSESFGEKSFNMTDELREPCLKALFEEGIYGVQENDDETVRNMIERYKDIEHSFPEELSEDALPYFIDWFIENVVIVEIKAYSDENAYMIFETMNDRGLNLTPTEMLKGYVLSRITDIAKRTEINDIWKNQIQELHEYGETEDQTFFQAWFRSKYAQTIRPGKAGSKDKDFELIASRFHNWFKDNHKKLFNLRTSNEFYNFFKDEFPFFVKWHINSWESKVDYNNQIPHLHYIHYWGIAESLQGPLLLASINYKDEDNVIIKKLDFTSRFIETFTVRRSINYRKFGQTSIKYTMFNMIKLIRNNSLTQLCDNLISSINEIDEKWDTASDFGMHKQNGRFVKHLLSRISSYVDEISGDKDTNYDSYQEPKGTLFEIEHIWANKFKEHKDEFEQEGDFESWRNSIGALVLLPNGPNQSYNDDPYEDKIDHYLKENRYVQTLHPLFYEKNPKFLKSEKVKQLQFKPHPKFKLDDIIERDKLVQRICEQLWSTDYYKLL